MPRLKSKPNPKLSQLMLDFIKLAKWENYLKDHGPQVYLYRGVADQLKLNLEDRLWFSILGMAYYQEGSGWIGFQTDGVRKRKRLPPINLPIGTLRRNLYGGRIKKHFQSLYTIDSFSDWLEPALKDWLTLIKRISSVWGNGKWSSYTTAEALVDIADLPIVPTNEGFLFNSGPRDGIESLGLPVTPEGVKELLAILKAEGVNIPVQILETVMCNWNNLRVGTFYIGRSLDRQQTRILEAEKVSGINCAQLWKARKKVFRSESLGELQGWRGLDTERLRIYRDTGELLLPWEER